jgi:hypothetical protein
MVIYLEFFALLCVSFDFYPIKCYKLYIMPFGKKAKQIETLTTSLNELRNHPQIQLAEQLQTSITDAISEGDFDIDDVLSKVETDEVLRMARVAIDKLPALVMLHVYAERVGDKKINEFLAQRALSEFQREKDAQLLRDLKEEAKLSRRLDLSRLPLGSVVTIGLFDPEDDDDEKCFDEADYAMRTITGRIDHPDRPHMLTVIKDQHDDDYKKVKGVPKCFHDHTLVQFGSLLWQNDESRFVPELTHRTYPALKFDGEGPKVVPYDIGYVTVGDDVVLDYEG